MCSCLWIFPALHSRQSRRATRAVSGLGRARTRKRFPQRRCEIEPWSPVEKILVPLDFSACSVAGLEFAIRFASRWDAQLVLFNAVPIRAFVPYGDYGGRELPDITGYAQDAAKQEMEDLISKLRTRGIKVEAAVELGSAAEEICDHAREQGVDLIITSTHGSTGLGHVVIGSTAEHVVRYAYCPVLVVPIHPRRGNPA